MTLEQLAEQTNLSKSALGSYEAEDFKDISHYALMKLAKFYDVTADYLLGLSEIKLDDHYDEHVWLSLKNAIVCTETLADAITELDSDNAKQYVTNAKTYTGKLEALDDDYQTMRDAATQTTILVGDRFPFLYLAEDYDIHYFAAYSGCSADVEASVHTVTYLAEKLQEYKLQAIYVVDNGTDSLANTIAESAEMQPKILHLSSMQSVTKDDIEKGCTYLSYMEENLQMLKQGLQAP